MRTFGLLGYALTHSFSKKYFTEKFMVGKITDARYELFPIKNIQEFPALLKHEPDLSGLNVTIPYKEQIIPFLDELDETAKAVGAVNCIRVQRHPNKETPTLLKGYNTDVYGFQQSIKPFLEQHHQRALILGTGGASKAVAYVLKQIGLDVCKVSRVNGNIPGQVTYSELNKNIVDSYTLIINTSPLGTFPETEAAPAIPYEYLSPRHFLYDLVYNPEETLFLKKGKQYGAQTMNGLTMLKLQADKAWEIFGT